MHAPSRTDRPRIRARLEGARIRAAFNVMGGLTDGGSMMFPEENCDLCGEDVDFIDEF